MSIFSSSLFHNFQNFLSIYLVSAQYRPFISRNVSDAFLRIPNAVLSISKHKKRPKIDIKNSYKERAANRATFIAIMDILIELRDVVSSFVQINPNPKHRLARLKLRSTSQEAPLLHSED